MKILCALAVLFAVHVPVLAGIKIPKGVFLIDQYDEALKQAKEQKKPLAIVRLDETAEGKGAEEIAEETFKSVTATAVTLFVSSRKENEQTYFLAPPFITASNEIGKHYLPDVMLCAPSEDVVWKIMYPPAARATVKELKQIFRNGVAEAKPAITAYFGDRTPPAFVHPGDKPLVWPFVKGKGFTGPFVKVEGENLFIKTPKGEVASPIPLKDLQPATIRYAKMLASLNAASAAEPKSAPEKWTNSKGKEIEASFVKLADGKVTLHLTTGNDYTLPLTELSEASQTRAKELAAKAAKAGK
jgi:hypothetical protein